MLVPLAVKHHEGKMIVHAYDDSKGFGRLLKDVDNSVALFRSADEIPEGPGAVYMRLNAPSNPNWQNELELSQKILGRNPAQFFPSPADLILKNNKYLQARILHSWTPKSFTSRDASQTVRYLLGLADYPQIAKRSMGAGSRYCTKLSGKFDAYKYVASLLMETRFLRSPDGFRDNPVVIQKFIEGLTHDYKVILIGGSVGWIVRRQASPLTGFASGSGIFEYVTEESSLATQLFELNRELSGRFNLFSVANDYGIRDGEALLLEAGCDFPSGFSHPPVFWERTNGIWERKLNGDPHFFQNLILSGFRARHFELSDVQDF